MKTCSECGKPKKHMADITVASNGTVINRVCWACWVLWEYADFYTDKQIEGLWKGKR